MSDTCSGSLFGGVDDWEQDRSGYCVNIKCMDGSSHFRVEKADFSPLPLPSIKLWCMQGSVCRLNVKTALRLNPAVAGDRMMNSRLCSRIQDQSRGKLLTGEGVPGQCTQNEQVREAWKQRTLNSGF